MKLSQKIFIKVYIILIKDYICKITLSKDNQ